MAPVSGTRRGSVTRVRIGAWWRSPEDQPGWARPALLGLTVVAGFLYGWRAYGNLEIYYAAAVRSMSMSWHDFVFAAFDPTGTITVDKLPGAFWVQALSVRVFGLHAWAIVAPQVVEGMASVLVLYRVVRRLSGALAGIVAAAVLVVSPATVLLNRGNIPDTLMILLLLLAADATVSAILSGRLRSLVVAGILVGLAFQAKMIEAWLVLPALALAYLVGARESVGRRLARLGAAGVVVAAVSLAWMVFVSLWPASHRPYVDGSSNNSIFHQVFVYNGFGRIDQASPNQLLTKAIGLTLGSTQPGWDRLLNGVDGHDTAWLIPAALVALVACVLASRRGDQLIRAATAMWGTWLVVLLIVFSASTTINPYYLAALSPAIASLLGMGVALAWEHRAEPAARRVVAATVAVTCAYAIWLLPSQGVGVVSWLPEVVGVIGVAAVAALLIPVRMLTRAGALALALGRGARGSRGSVDLGRQQAVRTVRHPVRRRGRVGDRPEPWGRREADGGAAPGDRDRGPQPAGSDGDADLGRGRAVHLRQRPRGGPDRRVHGDDPRTVGGGVEVDDRQGRLPPRDPVADGHRPAARGNRATLLPAPRRLLRRSRHPSVRRLLLRPRTDPLI